MTRIYYPGLLTVPILLLLMTGLSVMERLGMIQVAQMWNFWPVTLIATGLEELFLWATSKGR